MPVTDKDGLIWEYRAMKLMRSVLTLLTFMRDNGDVTLNATLIEDYLNLDVILRCSEKENLPKEVRDDLKDYLTMLPGFKKNETEQYTSVLEHHGYHTMQFISVLYKLKNMENDSSYLLITESF